MNDELEQFMFPEDETHNGFVGPDGVLYVSVEEYYESHEDE